MQVELWDEFELHLNWDRNEGRSLCAA